MQKVLRGEGTKIPALHGTQGLVFTDGGKAKAFAEAIERDASVNHHPNDELHYEAT
ncbi:hypothetical protein D910_00687, partial [Dendroctonus ponderosae]